MPEHLPVPSEPPAAPRIYPGRPREPEQAPPLPDFSAELNAEQLRAATHGEGPLLIIAGAGTGKTRTLVYRVAHLIAKRVAPERILLLTFTRRAAQEMLGRVERLVGNASARVHGGTFHATGHRLLRQLGQHAGLPKGFSILDQGDAEDLMGLARSQLGYGAKARRFPKKESLHWLYSRHVNTGTAIEDIVRDEIPQFLDDLRDMERVFAEYVSRKQERNLVDYDDLLLFWAMMLEQSEELRARIAGMYDYVLVDEYQDTNWLQARILAGMCHKHKNLGVVGDDAQSIYSFRGASFRNILDFPGQYPGTTIVTLEQNYRSTQRILDASNLLISRARERFTKNLWSKRGDGEHPWLVTARDEQQQTRFVVDRILELHEEGIPLKEMAVIFRAGYMSADLEIELTNRKIPFEKWGGLKFLEAAHVKDVLAFLRVLDNPRDEVSWYRLLQLLPGVGDATARNAIAAIRENSWSVEGLRRFKAPPRAREGHARLIALLDDLSRTSPESVSGSGQRAAGSAPSGQRAAGSEPGVNEDIHTIRRLYDDILRDKYDRPDPRLRDLDQLETIAAGYPSRAVFLNALALEPPSGTQDLGGPGGDTEDDCLILSTAHSAKGKEWDAVFLIWAVDGWFPSSRALRDEDETEEERRLMYVALTRARNHLAIVYPLAAYSSMRGADYTIDQLSRFIDRGVRAKMEQVALGTDDKPIQSDVEVPVAMLGRVMDLRALMGAKFKRLGPG